ncbi:unnamed protein product [Amoebophrya sp. A25]|nr:unnamed protein product [Amoebophrya sp. A25]|eukprot:GSA25T00022714001.1
MHPVSIVRSTRLPSEASQSVLRRGRRPMHFSALSHRSSTASLRGGARRAFASAASSFDVFAKLKDSSGGEAEEKNKALKRKPSDRVLNLADEIMSLTLIEAADLCDLCQERLTPGDGSPIPGRMPFPHPMAMFGSMMPQAMPPGAHPGMAPAAAPAAPQPAAAEPGAAEPAAKAAEPEKPKAPAGPVSLKLVSFEAAKKIAVIKEVRGLTALGLAQSKELVERTQKGCTTRRG